MAVQWEVLLREVLKLFSDVHCKQKDSVQPVVGGSVIGCSVVGGSVVGGSNKFKPIPSQIYLLWEAEL